LAPENYRELISDLIIPAGEARAFLVEKGQILRIAQIDGHQVGDVIIFNAHDYKEHFNVSESLILNWIEGTGDLKHIEKFYSQPSRENLMFTVLEDTTKVHFIWNGARCSPKIYAMRDKIQVPPHRSCQTNLAGAIAPYGLSADDVPDVFNVFMNVDIVGNKFEIKPPIVGKDDYIDMEAQMDCLVAISACPSDRAITNAGSLKPLRAEIFKGKIGSV
jgi:uncharacterized protein